MGRKRELTAAMGLLPRMEAWRWADGKTITYRYHPVGKKPIPLGTMEVIEHDAYILPIPRLA